MNGTATHYHRKKAPQTCGTPKSQLMRPSVQCSSSIHCQANEWGERERERACNVSAVHHENMLHNTF